VARYLVFNAMSCIWLPMRRHSTIALLPIWLAYSRRSPTELAILAVNKKGTLSAAVGISIHTFSSLRQMGNRPLRCVASLIKSANGLSALGSTGLGAAMAGGLATAALSVVAGVGLPMATAGVRVAMLAHPPSKVMTVSSVGDTQFSRRGCGLPTNLKGFAAIG